MNNNITQIVKDLISRKKEGDYWDFKVIHHKNNKDLIKDIICLANVTSHKGDRYIIFGVKDGTYEIMGLDENKNLNNIMDLLKNTSFANKDHPDIDLEAIELEGKKLDVLIIKDKPKKPYYLDKQYKFDSKFMYAGTIYSRTGDRNTADDSVASVAEIEMMWKERFGLDQDPLDRVLQYLKRADEWMDRESISYFKQFPEFTIDR